MARGWGRWPLQASRCSRWSSAFALFSVACSCPYRPLAQPDANAAPTAVYPSAARLPASDELAVIGDVQRTSSLECCLLGREVNDREQGLLLDDMARQAPNAVVLLGDLAFDADDANWAHFDALMAPLRVVHGRSEPRFFPVLGNHDYDGFSWRAAAQRVRRFPRLATGTHYAVDWGSVRLLVLDGNREQLCPPAPRSLRCAAEWQAQLEWLEAELRAVDAAPAGERRAAILFVHQSPYTQSSLVAADQFGVRDFSRLLLQSNRGLALLSAHAHGYERYRYARDASDQRLPKYFIVSAGGGGPRPRARRAGAPPDEARLPWPRPFNYLLLRQDQAGVHLSARGLDTGEPRVRALEGEQLFAAFR